MKEIPVSAAKRIARDYGYDQIVVYARKVGEGPGTGEHVTTYGVDPEHCSVAARMGDHLKYNVFGWPRPEKPAPEERASEHAWVNQGVCCRKHDNRMFPGMIVCPNCGDKRCGRAEDCAADCDRAPDKRSDDD